MAETHRETFLQLFFKADDSLADVIFLVEEKPIYFCKALLMVSSPVFARMFTSDFKEREAQIIPLPEKTQLDFLRFLTQLYPAHSWTPLQDDELEPLLKLADEYDVAHIKEKCEHFIRDKMEFILSTNQVMRYLWLSEVYHLTDLQAKLLVLAADHPTEELEGCEYFSMLEPPTQLALMTNRCLLLEEEKVDHKRLLLETGRMIQKMKPLVHKLPAVMETLPQKCTDCCAPCRRLNNRCSGKWSGTVTGSDVWCDSCVTEISSFQQSFCKGCIVKKTAILVRSLSNLLHPIKEAPWINSYSFKNMQIRCQ